jgi:hypothetical protein
MLSVKAIYDGKSLRLLENVKVDSPKHVILTFLDDPASDISSEELHYLSEKSGALDFLNEEEEIYSDRDLKIKYK